MGVENYHVIELVGEGSFGKVYKGRRKFTGQVHLLFPSFVILIGKFVVIFSKKFFSFFLMIDCCNEIYYEAWEK